MADNRNPTADVAPSRIEPSMVATAKGIFEDVLELMKQQIVLLKVEIRSDVHNLVASMIPLACSVLPLLLGGLMICFALVHGLHWATLPPGATVEPAAIPLWGCYAIVSTVFLLTGAAFVGVGQYRLRRAHAVWEQSVKALEENLRWLMNKNLK
jgi:hypothetical protein